MAKTYFTAPLIGTNTALSENGRTIEKQEDGSFLVTETFVTTVSAEEMNDYKEALEMEKNTLSQYDPKVEIENIDNNLSQVTQAM